MHPAPQASELPAALHAAGVWQWLREVMRGLWYFSGRR